LFHLSSPPARATEIFTITILNQQNERRSVYIKDKKLYIVIGYAKVSQ